MYHFRQCIGELLPHSQHEFKHIHRVKLLIICMLKMYFYLKIGDVPQKPWS